MKMGLHLLTGAVPLAAKSRWQPVQMQSMNLKTIAIKVKSMPQKKGDVLRADLLVDRLLKLLVVQDCSHLCSSSNQSDFIEIDGVPVTL